jgi:hypothetical protein
MQFNPIFKTYKILLSLMYDSLLQSQQFSRLREINDLTGCLIHANAFAGNVENKSNKDNPDGTDEDPFSRDALPWRTGSLGGTSKGYFLKGNCQDSNSQTEGRFY